MMPERQQGFTLLEVMVALAVLAIALAGVMKAVSSHTANAAYLQEKTLAHWVAMNKVNEYQMLRKWPSPGSREKGTAIMGGHEWVWKSESELGKYFDQLEYVATTIEVRFAEDDKTPRATLFMAFPLSK